MQKYRCVLKIGLPGKISLCTKNRVARGGEISLCSKNRVARKLIHFGKDFINKSGGLESGGLEAGGLEARTTDFADFDAHACPYRSNIKDPSI